MQYGSQEFNIGDEVEIISLPYWKGIKGKIVYVVEDIFPFHPIGVKIDENRPSIPVFPEEIIHCDMKKRYGIK